MNTLVALFRGINVGGHNNLPMQQLREILASLGCEDAKTYIQSGNAVFSSAMQPAKLAVTIESAIDDNLGFRPGVLVLEIEAFKAIAAANPYPNAADNPTHLHISFLAATPSSPDLDALERLRAPTESFALDGDAFYLHAPEGIGRSKLAAKVEKALGVAGTGRNWRTVSKILELADDIIS